MKKGASFDAEASKKCRCFGGINGMPISSRMHARIYTLLAVLTSSKGAFHENRTEPNDADLAGAAADRNGAFGVLLAFQPTQLRLLSTSVTPLSMG
ncbi:MAG: hypothetical protein IPK16_20760 [Anaerolineales bacterium]|nr:hypothetical protein [Anaerolineales bacterium]